MGRVPVLRSERFRVDGVAARDVAAAFQRANSTPDDPLVRAAYGQLSDQVDKWFTMLTRSGAQPTRVAFTASAEAYADASELAQSVRLHHVLEIQSVGDDHDRRHPLLDPSKGGVHDRFRAVHDIVSHGRSGHSFDRDGEYSAWRSESRMYGGLAAWALATELHAHHSVRWTSGELAPYKAVLLERSLLATSIQAATPIDPGAGPPPGP